MSAVQIKHIEVPLDGQKPPNYNQHIQTAPPSPRYQSSFQWRVSATEPAASSGRHEQRLENVNNTSLVWLWSSLGLPVRNGAQPRSTERTKWKLAETKKERRTKKKSLHGGIITSSENRLYQRMMRWLFEMGFSDVLFLGCVIWPSDFRLRLRTE